MMTNNTERVARELRSACCVASFESTSYDTYCATLTDALRGVWDSAESLSTRKSGCVRYESSVIDSILFSRRQDGIPWSELIHHHNRKVNQALQTNDPTNMTTKATTPLETVTLHLRNPSIVPLVCFTPVAVGLVQILVELPVGPDTPAQRTLLDCLSHVAFPSTLPAAQLSFSRKLFDYVSRTFPESCDACETYNVEQANRMMALLQHLAKDRHSGTVLGPTILKCCLWLIRVIDDADVYNLQSRSTPNTSLEHCLCSYVDVMSSTKNRRRGMVASLDQMHDESLSDSAAQQHTDNGEIELRIATLPTGSHVPCELCQSMPMPRTIASSPSSLLSDITQLSPKLVVLRAKLFRALLSTFAHLQMQSAYHTLQLAAGHGTRQRLQRNTDSGSMLLETVVHFASCFPDSPSMRLCILLLADSLSSRGYHVVMQSLWRLYAAHELSRATTQGVLRVYVELVTECSHCDHPQMCWNAMRPLMKSLVQLCGTAQHDKDNDANANTMQTRLLLRCFSCILRVRRRTLLSHKSKHPVVQRELQQVVAKLAIAFGHVSWWVSADMKQNERDETVHTLQAVGVIGFLDEAVAHVNAECPIRESTSPQESDWPYPKLLSVRSALQRGGPQLGSNRLLSTPHSTSDNMTVDSESSDESSSGAAILQATSDDRLVAHPLLHYLHEDVLLEIFLFLGYKRLVRASGVCKVFHALANRADLWRQAYRKRFRVVQADLEDSLTGKASDNLSRNDWKQLFVNKILAERELCFKRHASGWKHRTCDRLGCLMVLKSPDQLKRHAGAHEKAGKKTKRRKRVCDSDKEKDHVQGTTRRRRLDKQTS